MVVRHRLIEHLCLQVELGVPREAPQVASGTQLIFQVTPQSCLGWGRSC